MSSPLVTGDAIREHVLRKRDAFELRDAWADQMLAALDAGAEPDYRALLHAAMFPDPPSVVYHTAPRSAREPIGREGLRVSQPGAGGSWAPNKPICVMLQGGQPPGVYVAAEPDVRGVWSHWPQWDVWAIVRGALPWAHDELNPGCWRLDAPVSPSALELAYAR